MEPCGIRAFLSVAAYFSHYHLPPIIHYTVKPRAFLLSMACMAAPLMAVASRQATDTIAPKPTSEKVVITRYLSDGSVRTDSIINKGQRNDILLRDTEAPKVSPSPPDRPKRTKMSNVMIGAELSTGLDLSGSDMSTFNADILAGYRHKVIQLLGLSLGIHKSLGTRDSFIPVQLVFRTGFRPRPSLMFMHVSAGYSFNTIASSPMFGDFIATLGCGINLTQQPRFQSKVILAIGFRHFTEKHQAMASITKPNLGFAQISFGISM